MTLTIIAWLLLLGITVVLTYLLSYIGLFFGLVLIFMYITG